MSYLEGLLIPGETVVYRARRSVFPTFAGPVATLVLVLAAAVAATAVGWPPEGAGFVWLFPLLPALWLGWRYLFWTHKVYMVTSHRVLKLEGVVAKSHADASLDKINDMGLQQGLLGRLLGYGDLEISTANETASVTYHFLDGPVEFKRRALMSREAARSVPGAAPVPAGDDVVSKLERLGGLREKGVVTEEEFQAAKAELLAKGK